MYTTSLAAVEVGSLVDVPPPVIGVNTDLKIKYRITNETETNKLRGKAEKQGLSPSKTQTTNRESDETVKIIELYKKIVKLRSHQ